MRVLVLWASEKSPNLGVAVLARGSVGLMRRVWPDAEVVCTNYGDRPQQLPLGSARSLLKEHATGRLGMTDWLKTFDLAWDTRSGDSFADIYGLGRHVTMSTLHELIVRSGVPTIMAPQTLGPFSGRRARALARRNMRRSTRVFARDAISAEHATKLGRPVDATVSDLVFAIGSPSVDQTRDVVLNVSGLLWQENPHVHAGEYRGVIQEVMKELSAAHRHVTLLAHVRNSQNPDDDVAAVREVHTQFPDTDVVVPADLDSARETLASARIVIGSRMHACLNALSAGVPAIPLAYSRKFAPLLDSLDWPHSIDLRQGRSVAEQVMAKVSGPDLSAAAQDSKLRGEASMNALVSDLKTVVR